MRVLLKQAVGYGVASGFALAIDMSFLWILVRYFEWGYIPAASLAFMTGAVVVYLFSVRLVFKEHRLANRGAEFASFVAIGVLGLVINVCVIDACVRYLGLQVMIAKCIAATCTFSCNFMARRQILFIRPRDSQIRDLSHE